MCSGKNSSPARNLSYFIYSSAVGPPFIFENILFNCLFDLFLENFFYLAFFL